jgi:hypothetical protein
MVLIGRVVDAEDGSPVQGAVVTALVGVGRVAVTATRNDGTYRLVVPLSRVGSATQIAVRLSRLALIPMERRIVVRPAQEVQCDFFMFYDLDFRMLPFE